MANVLLNSRWLAGGRPPFRPLVPTNAPVQARGYENAFWWTLQLIPPSPGLVGGSGKFCDAPDLRFIDDDNLSRH